MSEETQSARQTWAREILTGINKQLRDRFEEIREQHFNPNTKGYEYEKIVAAFLGDYVSGLFDLHARVGLIDKDLGVFERFRPSENEFDVVATFKNACPGIILKIGETKMIPYDAVAFLVEVKQTLTEERLNHDINKLVRLNDFDCSGRFGLTFTGDFSINRPLKTLLYYESSISEQALTDILTANAGAWDLLVLFSGNLLYANPALPIVRANMSEPARIARMEHNPMLNYLLFVQSSMTLAPVTSTMRTFLELLRVSREAGS